MDAEDIGKIAFWVMMALPILGYIFLGTPIGPGLSCGSHFCN